MSCFRDYLEGLSESSGINYRIVLENGEITYPDHIDFDDSETASDDIQLGEKKAKLVVSKNFNICLPLLKYTIEDKYNELSSNKDQILNDILEGKNVSTDRISSIIPFISEECFLYVIYVEENILDARNIIVELYIGEKVMTTIYGNYIVAFGVFNEVDEHARSIKESIQSELYCKCFVSYAESFNDVKTLIKSFEHARECMMLGKKFSTKEEIFSYNQMIFEKIVYNMNSEIKADLMSMFKSKLNSLDSELIITIEEFIKSGLNTSEAARKLYVHRNTLIYRLDKIYKETGFDIRNFKEATIFIIGFLVWKSSVD